MGRTYDSIDFRVAQFMQAQHLFFVATAPLSAGGHVNCSPKSNNGELVVLDERRVAYLDRTGSGAETIAHLRENGRVVLMFCAFEGPPRIVRVHGHGEAVLRDADAARFTEIAARFDTGTLTGARSVVVVTAERISDSCGYAVPLMGFTGHRVTLDEWAERKGDEGIRAYWAGTNVASLDGLPAIPVAARVEEA